MNVTVVLNAAPVIASIRATETFSLGEAGPGASVEAEVTVVASDADGDELGYTWSSPSCPGGVFTSPDPPDPTRVVFRHQGGEACELRVEVRDFRRDPPGGITQPVARGGEVVGTVVLSRPPTLVTP